MATLSDLRKLLSGYKTEEFNTNNAWGFGGASGKRYLLDDQGTEVHVKLLSYRHLPPDREYVVYEGGKIVVATRKVSGVIQWLHDKGWAK